VERVLEVYNDPRTDLYDVLGVRRSISDAALRKAYRAKALTIHPGIPIC
jgi:curved DNA-binding protein CbpA